MNAREVGYENKFFDVPWGIAIDHGIFFGMKAAAISWLFAIAAIGQSRGVAIVSNGQNFSKISGRDDSSHFEADASGSLSQRARQLKIDAFKRWTF